MKTLEAYLTDAVLGKTNPQHSISVHTLTVKPRGLITGEGGQMVPGPLTFYIHPQGLDGETLDFEVHGNALSTDPSVTREGE